MILIWGIDFDVFKFCWLNKFIFLKRKVTLNINKTRQNRDMRILIEPGTTGVTALFYAVVFAVFFYLMIRMMLVSNKKQNRRVLSSRILNSCVISISAGLVCIQSVVVQIN